MVSLRAEWVAHGLATAPADRATAEATVTELYRLAGAPEPEFHWVPSPAAAVSLIAAGAPDRGGAQQPFQPARLRAHAAPALGGDWPVAARLASMMSDLRDRMDARIEGHQAAYGWDFDFDRVRLARTMEPEEALRAGVTPRGLLHAAVREPLTASLADAVRLPMRTGLLPPTAGSPGLTWYGQHDADWIGYYDAHARTGATPFRHHDARQLDLWATLARSTGWWWPDDGRCVMAERPAEIRTEPLPGGRLGEVRLHHPDRPAVRYADGTALHVLHGTPVPEWVITDPTIERIHREPNVEVRRCAIERIGWDAYVELSGLQLVGTAADPGNPGSDLRLYHLPRQVWGRPARVLLVVNGSVEPNGRRRRYGLRVPASVDDPVSAAGWSYGLSGAQYAQLARRT